MEADGSFFILPSAFIIGFERAVSRILSALLRAERIICLSSLYPEPVPLGGTWSGPLRSSLFGLAPDGVFRASALALGAVGSYPTFSPLPELLAKPGRFIFCGTFRRHASRRGLPRVSRGGPSYVGPRRLRGIAPGGVRTFLLPGIAPRKAILRPPKTNGTIYEAAKFLKRTLLHRR